MKRWVWLGALASIVAAGGIAAALSNGDTVTVRVMNGKILKDPKFVAGQVAAVARGDHLTFEQAQKDWYKVKNDGGDEGWIHKSQVTEGGKNLSTVPGETNGGANEDEVELAGRGFSPEVEQEYKNKHPDLNYEHINNIEKVDIDGDTVAKFAADGQLPGGK